MEIVFEQELRTELERLPPSKQMEVLKFARALKSQSAIGVPGAQYQPWTNPFDPADLAEMESAIDEDCERIDANEW